jgi:hypothetical protein
MCDFPTSCLFINFDKCFDIHSIVHKYETVIVNCSQLKV